MSEQTSEIVKPKRAYTRRQTPAIPPAPPAPPSAAVTALEAQVLELVAQRVAANGEIVNATAAANQANARVQAAQQNLKQLEHEVQYRLALIQQMKGSPARVEMSGSGYIPSLAEIPLTGGGLTFTGAALPEVNGFGVSIPQGVSSIPAPVNTQTVFASGTRVRGPRSESAEGFRAEEVGVRAAI